MGLVEISSQFSGWEFSVPGGFTFGAGSQHGLERLFELGFDVDVFEDSEVRAMFIGVESTIFTGDDDDRDVRGFRLGFERGDEFRTAHPRHLHVSDDDVGMKPFDDGKRFLAIGGRLDGMAALRVAAW